MSKLIKIVHSPFTPPVEVVDGIVLSLHVPYSKTSATIIVNPNIQEYKENSDAQHVKVRQVILTTTTNETKQLTLDFSKNKKKKVNIENIEYEIELINIGEENINGQNFPYFEFNVDKKG